MTTSTLDTNETEAVSGELLPAIAITEELFVPNGLDKIIAHIKAEVGKHTPDSSTERGRKAIASLARKIASSKTRMDDFGKEYVSKIKLQSSAIDAERKRMRDVLDQLKEDTRRPLTDWEDAEAARLKGHEDALTSLADLGNVPFGAELEEIGQRLDAADAYDARDWQEFSARYKVGREATTMFLKRLWEQTKVRDDERAEFLRLQEQEVKRQQEERETRMKEEAAAQAKLQAEAEAKRVADETARRVEQEKAAIERARLDAEERTRQSEHAAQEAAAKAVRDAEAAATKAKADQERAIELERRRVAEAKRMEEEAAAKREASTKHRNSIDKEICEKLVSCGFTKEISKALIVAISKGDIPHVKITY